MRELLHAFGHPKILLMAALLALGVLPPPARFFFGSFAEFKRELGLEDPELWLLGFVPRSPMIYFKGVGFLGGYGITVLGVYSILSHVAWFGH